MFTIRQKESARKKVLTAVRNGTLIRPILCELCNQPSPDRKDGRPTIQGHHHKGYHFPLEVQWLCIKCHDKIDLAPNGEDQHLAKLTWETVREIRRRYKPRPAHGMGRTGMMEDSTPSLAEEFGVNQKTIWSVVTGRTWKENR